jgi:hypothetical protein
VLAGSAEGGANEILAQQAPPPGWGKCPPGLGLTIAKKTMKAKPAGPHHRRANPHGLRIDIAPNIAPFSSREQQLNMYIYIYIYIYIYYLYARRKRTSTKTSDLPSALYTWLSVCLHLSLSLSLSLARASISEDEKLLARLICFVFLFFSIPPPRYIPPTTLPGIMMRMRMRMRMRMIMLMIKMRSNTQPWTADCIKICTFQCMLHWCVQQCLYVCLTF